MRARPGGRRRRSRSSSKTSTTMMMTTTTTMTTTMTTTTTTRTTTIRTSSWEVSPGRARGTRGLAKLMSGSEAEEVRRARTSGTRGRGPGSRKHGALPALGLLVFLCCLVYSGLFAGEIAGDDLTFHFAESARLADCIRAGDFDWWNPSANAGYASAYYYQVIPQLTSAIPAAIFGHLLFWFQLSNFLPLVLAPVAAYRGMRLLGASPWQAFAGAFAVAMMNGESRWGAGAAGSFQVGLYIGRPGRLGAVPARARLLRPLDHEGREARAGRRVDRVRRPGATRSRSSASASRSRSARSRAWCRCAATSSWPSWLGSALPRSAPS